MKAYIFTKYQSDKRDLILEKKVIISDLPRFEIMKLDTKIICDWEECDVEFQPKRLNPEDARCTKSLPDCLNWCDCTSVCDSLTSTNK